jgi:hypothetical protein
VVDQQAAERRRIRRVVGQDRVHLVLVVQAVRLESLRQEAACRQQQGPAPRKRGQASIANERVLQMDAGIATSHVVRV